MNGARMRVCVIVSRFVRHTNSTSDLTISKPMNSYFMAFFFYYQFAISGVGFKAGAVVVALILFLRIGSSSAQMTTFVCVRSKKLIQITIGANGNRRRRRRRRRLKLRASTIANQHRHSKSMLISQDINDYQKYCFYSSQSLTGRPSERQSSSQVEVCFFLLKIIKQMVQQSILSFSLLS